MRYIFLDLNGNIEKTNNPKELVGFSWTDLNFLKPKYAITKEENKFFKKYGLKSSVFNVALLQHINKVYLTESQFNNLKGGLK